MHARLKNARLARGLSLDEVSALLRAEGVIISKAALSKYERDQSSPPASMLTALAKILRVEPAFFFETSRNNVVWGDFRKNSKLGKKEQTQLQAIASNCVQSLVWLEEALLLEAHPRLSQRDRVRVSGLHEAEFVAESVRQAIGLGYGPLAGIIEVLERNGVVVLASEHIQDTEFDGLSGWLDEHRPLIVIRSNAPVDRLRFSLAHELGHLMLDCDGLSAKEREDLAHRFASAFIVPRAAAFAELGSLRRNLNLSELGLLKRKYGLSIQAWIRRVFDLGIINESLYRKLIMEVSSRGWRRAEPGKFDYPGIEETSHLKQYTLRALHEGLISAQRASELCPALREVTGGLEDRCEVPATEILKLSPEERNRILEAAATLAYDDYANNQSLTDFKADDLIEY
ncbi:ImmA/IrrE family metallo-endopeptidase [bacterium]|nr:ImmA/IrrE family metallo-endopeptidase [bacterium]